MGLVIYKSSAGSGKTFTLVQQFLIKVIGQPWLFQRILAITFTNKATEELKTRIIKELDLLAHGEKSMHLEVLTGKTSET
jgi:ATP-dependent helicase/nuclease subunit A